MIFTQDDENLKSIEIKYLMENEKSSETFQRPSPARNEQNK